MFILLVSFGVQLPLVPFIWPHFRGSDKLFEVDERCSTINKFISFTMPIIQTHYAYSTHDNTTCVLSRAYLGARAPMYQNTPLKTTIRSLVGLKWYFFQKNSSSIVKLNCDSQRLISLGKIQQNLSKWFRLQVLHPLHCFLYK
jgi:hypothetical protein